MKTEVRVITPQVAEEMLKRNHGNRKASQRHVEFLSNEMTSGNWQFDGQPIRFTESGKLLDGQHRLLAISLSKTKQEFLVITGINSDAFKVMDTGKSRNGSDVLSIDGVKSSATTAAAIRHIIAYRLGLKTGANGVNRVSNSDLIKFVHENKSIVDIVSETQKYYLSFNRVVSWSLMAAFRFLMNEKNTVYSESFWSKLATGLDLSENSPIFHLRNKLTADALAVKKMKASDKKAYIIKAWNLYRTDKEVKHLRVDLSSDKAFKII